MQKLTKTMKRQQTWRRYHGTIMNTAASKVTNNRAGQTNAINRTPPWTQCGMINWKRRRKKKRIPLNSLLLLIFFAGAATSGHCGLTPTNAVGHTLHQPLLTDSASLTYVTRTTDPAIITETDRTTITTRSILRYPCVVASYITGHRRPTTTTFLHSRTTLNAKPMFTTGVNYWLLLIIGLQLLCPSHPAFWANNFLSPFHTPFATSSAALQRAEGQLSPLFYLYSSRTSAGQHPLCIPHFTTQQQHHSRICLELALGGNRHSIGFENFEDFPLGQDTFGGLLDQNLAREPNLSSQTFHSDIGTLTFFGAWRQLASNRLTNCQDIFGGLFHQNLDKKQSPLSPAFDNDAGILTFSGAWRQSASNRLTTFLCFWRTLQSKFLVSSSRSPSPGIVNTNNNVARPSSPPQHSVCAKFALQNNKNIIEHLQTTERVNTDNNTVARPSSPPQHSVCAKFALQNNKNIIEHLQTTERNKKLHWANPTDTESDQHHGNVDNTSHHSLGGYCMMATSLPLNWSQRTRKSLETVISNQYHPWRRLTEQPSTSSVVGIHVRHLQRLPRILTSACSTTRN